MDTLEVRLGREGFLDGELVRGAQGLFNCREVCFVFIELENILHVHEVGIVVSARDRLRGDHQRERRMGGVESRIVLEAGTSEIKRCDVHAFVVAVKHAVFMGRIAIAEGQTVE
jgi:hypothetical protein